VSTPHDTANHSATPHKHKQTNKHTLTHSDTDRHRHIFTTHSTHNHSNTWTQIHIHTQTLPHTLWNVRIELGILCRPTHATHETKRMKQNAKASGRTPAAKACQHLVNVPHATGCTEALVSNLVFFHWEPVCHCHVSQSVRRDHVALSKTHARGEWPTLSRPMMYLR
jgi:hypothetical protein